MEIVHINCSPFTYELESLYGLSHIRCKSDNISVMVQARDIVTTGINRK